MACADQGGAPPLSHGLDARAELQALALDALRKRAAIEGVSADSVADAMESPDPHTMLVKMIEISLVNAARSAIDAVHYPLPREAGCRPEVPAGKVTHHSRWRSKVFAETERDFFVYVPQQCGSRTAAKLIVCQDGHKYVDCSSGGLIRVPLVLDNMIASGELAPAVGLFIRPGIPLPAACRTGDGDCPQDDVAPKDWQRSFEYDSVTPKYGEMLINELIPMIEAEYGVRISANPMDRLVTGISSGAVCSMVTGFHHPDHFGCVFSTCASYVNIRGAHHLPWLVRNTRRKPLKVILQVGTNDNNNDHGHNQLGNEQMASALEYAGYDSTFVLGTGYHNLVHSAHIFPDVLRWCFCGGARPPLGKLASAQL
eukprot:SAG31_NODE_4123_length_3561_cov_3.577701_4_plen_370_part_00